MSKTRDGIQRRLDIYYFLQSYIEKHGYPPTYREIADGVGISSTNTVHTHIHKLIEMGVISMVDNHPRTLKLLHQPIE